MITRRRVIQGVLTGAAIVSVPSYLALSRHEAAVLPFHAVLYDGRFLEGQQYGAESARHGSVVHDVGGNATNFWYGNLRHRWKEGAAAVAGLTTFSTFFSLKLMADPMQIRTTYLGYHHLGKGARHELFGLDTSVRSAIAGQLDAARGLWPLQVAMLMPVWMTQNAVARHSTLALAAQSDLQADSLVSWILAPRNT